MNNSFLGRGKTFITPLLMSQTEEDLILEIRNAIGQGADSFGFMMERLPKELRVKDKLRMFFAEMEGFPIYVTCYSNGDVIEETDDDRAEYLLQAIECGATMADIRGDMFAPCGGELTVDETAIEKQKALIEKIHKMGKEALISTHVHYDGKFSFLTKDEVLHIALEHQNRGADMAKIVTNADTDEELTENFKTFFYVREKLDIELLFLCNGKKALAHRLAGPLIGEPIVFVREKNHAADLNATQQPIEVIKKLTEYL